MQGSVTVRIAAPADRLWDLLTDVTSEPGREFDFAGVSNGRTVRIWRCRLEPVARARNGSDPADGTDVTESFQLAATPLRRLSWPAAGHWRMRTNLAAMRTTLERINRGRSGVTGRPHCAVGACVYRSQPSRGRRRRPVDGRLGKL